MVESVAGYLKYRVVNRITGAEIISDLPHLHQSKWEIRAMTPGGTASAALSKFTIPLPPPGSALYDKNASTLVQLWPGSGEGYRVEAYLGDVFSSTPRYAGVITNITLSTENGGSFTLEGYTDPWVLSLQRFFPGELTPYAAGTTNSTDRFQRCLAENILSWYDTFSPYNAANFTVVAGSPSYTVAAGTDNNGVNSNVVTFTGGGNGTTPDNAYLISKTGVAATLDPDHAHYQEFIFRCDVTAVKGGFTTVAFYAYLGFSTTPGSVTWLSNAIAQIAIQWNTATQRWDAAVNANGVAGSTLSSVDDGDGRVTIVVGLYINAYQFAISVNGQIALSSHLTDTNSASLVFDPGTASIYPVMQFTSGYANASPSLTIAATNWLHATRNNYKGNANAPFIAGTLGTPAHSLLNTNAQAPTMLDAITSIAVLEGWYWRYTPVRMASGSHPTMGKFDVGAAPGVDRSKGSSAGTNVIFEAGKNLDTLRIQGNSSTFASDLILNGRSSGNSGGSLPARNLAAIAKYGWLTDTSVGMTANDFNAFRLFAQSIANAKASPGGSYTARIRRDPDTADVWRELDYVTVHEPLLGLYYAKMLVVAYTFTEGAHEMDVTLGQYGINDVASASRPVSDGVRHIAGAFANR